MYLRINSTSVPNTYLGPGLEYVLSPDKSCILVKGRKDGHNLETPTLHVSPRCSGVVHVTLRPELGPTSAQVLSQVDGPQTLKFRVAAGAEELASLDYHFKIYFMPVDFMSALS